MRYDGAVEHTLGVGRQADFHDLVTVEGIDWSGSTFAGAVRAYRDAPGAALATMTISAPTYDAVTGITSFVRSIPKGAIAALPAAPEPHEDMVLWFDMTRTEDGVTSVIDCGKFIVHGRVTA